MKSALKVFGIIALVTIIGFSFAACGDGGGGDEIITVVSVTGVTLNKSATTMLIGNKETLTATVTPANAANKTVTWSTSNAGVATVAGGEITAVAKGSTVITVTTADGGKTATCNVTVSDTAVAVTGVSLNKSSTSITIGGTERLTVTFTPTGATNQNVTWSSSNTTVATVSNGTVTAKAAGTATITVTTVDGNKTATCVVTVNNRTLSGNITIVQTTGVTTGMIMYARYSGTETVSYQWKKDGVNVGTASTTNPNKFTPTTAGSYTVTVNATGFNSKESNAVTVTALATGEEIFYYGVIPAYDVTYLKNSDEESFYEEFEAGRLKQDTINKSSPKQVEYAGGGHWCVIVPQSLGSLIIKDGSGTNVTNAYPQNDVTFNGIKYWLHISPAEGSQTGLKLTFSYN